MLERLAGIFWPGPLTVILRKRPIVPDLVTAGEPTVAVRMPAHPVMLKLIALAGLPLAAPSANPFGYVSPTTAEHVRDSLGLRAPHILDGGPCRHGVESTIVNLADPAGVRLLRHGPVTLLSGPEGGLSPAEEQAALAAGFVPVNLGPRVLRSETAPLAVLAALTLG